MWEEVNDKRLRWPCRIELLHWTARISESVSSSWTSDTCTQMGRCIRVSGWSPRPRSCRTWSTLPDSCAGCTARGNLEDERLIEGVKQRREQVLRSPPTNASPAPLVSTIFSLSMCSTGWSVSSDPTATITGSAPWVMITVRGFEDFYKAKLGW